MSRLVMSDIVGIKWIDDAPSEYTSGDLRKLIDTYTSVLPFMVLDDFRQFGYHDVVVCDGYVLLTIYMVFERVTVRVYNVRASSDELKTLLNKTQGYTTLLITLATARVNEIVASIDGEIRELATP